MRIKIFIVPALLILLIVLSNACGIQTNKNEGVSANEEITDTSIITSERRNHSTPNGGDYSEIFYYDDDGNSVDKKIATKAIVREYKKDGTLINEIFADISKSE